MEISAQAQSSITQFKIRPSLSISSSHGRFNKSFQTSAWSKEYCGITTPSLIVTAADYSRRRPRKTFIPRGKGPAPKGFMPRTQVEPSTQKRDQSDNAEKESSETSSWSEYGESENNVTDMKTNYSEELESVGTISEETMGNDNAEAKESPVPSSSVSPSPEDKFVVVDDNISKEQSSEVIPKQTAFSKLQTNTEMLEDVEEQSVEVKEKKNFKAATLNWPGTIGSDRSNDTKGKGAVLSEKKDAVQLEKVETDDKDEMKLSVDPVVEVNYIKEINDMVDESEDEVEVDEKNTLYSSSVVKSQEGVSEEGIIVTTVDVPTLGEKKVHEKGKVVEESEVPSDKSLEIVSEEGTIVTNVDVRTLGEKKVHEKSKIVEESEVLSDKIQEIVSEQGTVMTNVDVPPLRENKVHEKGKNVEQLKVLSDKSQETVSEGVVVTNVDISTLGEKNVHDKGKIVEEPEVLSAKIKEEGTVIEIDEAIADLSKEKELVDVDTVAGKQSDIEEILLKQRQEMEAKALATCKKLLEDLAKENLQSGNKVFAFPQVVNADQNIEVFFNKSISVLKNEPDVVIMGAFNDWRWKYFNKKLHKTDLEGDWWACEVYIPKEAYKMDFVFNNGGDVYENNDSKDFFFPVQNGMDLFAFEDFLLEEKRRELEKLAAEQAERERAAEEERRREAERAASEADRAQAKSEAARRRERLHDLMKKASNSVGNVWYIEPSEFKSEDMIRLYYNRGSGPLAHSKEVWIHGGHNSWKDGLSIVGRLEHTEEKDGDWWHVDVVVPDRALILDWVFADGPPGSAKVYDNNKSMDFHATVPKTIPEELYWVEEEKQIYKKFLEERRQREEAIRAKAEKTARMKAETRERTLKMFLLSQKHIVYTEPLDVRAGSTITVFYNPSNTVLNGKPEVWFRCSFNRWTHRHGPLPPQKMVPAENGSHLKATVKVPLDAYMLDFVFSEKEDGGIYDNRNGMDYHIPVTGGVIKAPPMHIVHVSVEMAPIAKVGGLGDVVTSLSRAVQDLGHNVDIILPKYDCMNFSNVKDFHYDRSYSWGGTEIKVWNGKVEGLSVYFLEPLNGMFSVGCIYGCRNDGDRFGFFCHAALEYLLQSGFHPDILHCHDWSTAPVAWLHKEQYMHYGLSNARVVFTIHNLEFGAALIGKAMAYCDKSTTVSPNYAKEVAHTPAISPHLYKFHGILNGIDPDIWDPYNDKFIPVSYTAENVVEGKRSSKETLQRKLGLSTSERPLVGIVTRLTHQKGIHLIKHAIWRTLDRNGQVVLLGSAPDPRVQNDFVNLANDLHSIHNNRARLCLTYDEPLSHLIYAGADFILVPSMFEPCGLTQLIAMRYGSIPVVRKTGGLYDTVFDVDHDKERAQAQGLEPNGFSFDGTDNSGVDYALNRALSAWYNDRDWFNSLCKQVMEQDWSWNRPALDYMELYYSARK